jgi:hypothetical protein
MISIHSKYLIGWIKMSHGWIGLDIYQKKLVDSNGSMDYFDPSISNPI